MNTTNEVDAYNTILGNGKYGSTDRPITQMTMGELYDFGRNTLIPNTRDNEQLGLKGTGKGSSAVGAYQIVGDTMQDIGSKLYGDNWRNTQFSPEVQDAMAKVIYDRADKTNLHKVWTSLPKGDYSNSSFDDMKGVIQKGESGGTGYYTPSTRNQAKVNANSMVQSAPVENPTSALLPIDTSAIMASYADEQNSIAASRAELEEQRSALYPEDDWMFKLDMPKAVDVSKWITPMSKYNNLFGVGSKPMMKKKKKKKIFTV
jgi:hypothetical protein